MKRIPTVSIILPIRNEVYFISRCLQSILEQDYYPECVEIIIIDGLSTDGTQSVIKTISNNYPHRKIVLLKNPHHIFSMGFNIGLSHSKGDIIIMLGGHTEIGPEYISRCINYLEKYPDIDCVGGSIDTVAETSSSRAIALALGSPFGVGGVAFRTQSNRFMSVDTVAFAAYRRSIFDEIGLLDEEMVRNQDDEFNYRLRANGGRVLLAPDIHLRYYSRATIRALWRQYFQYGLWKVRVMQKHPRQMRPRHFIPFIFVSTLAACLFSTTFYTWGWTFFATLSIIYLTANILYSFRLVNRSDWKYYFKLPIIFATLHLSYGFGFMFGLIKFWNRWADNKTHPPKKESSEIRAKSI